MTHADSPHAASGLLVLADISGYTAFLETVGSAHPEMTARGGAVPPAYPILLSLLDVVTDQLAASMTPVHTEGDAVFAFADDDAVAGRHHRVLGTVGAAYVAFRGRIEEARILQNHECQACVLIGSLELKFVLHAGTFVVQPLPSRLHLAGPAVNLAHRLLKNTVTDRTGLRAYAFLTDAAAVLIGLPPGSGTTHEEAYPDAGRVSGTIVPLTVAV